MYIFYLLGVLRVCQPDETTPFTWVMAWYSAFPYIVVPFYAAALWRWKNLRSLLQLCLMLSIVTLSEGLLKPIVRQPRPFGSCDPTFGFPSSHSAISIAMLVWSGLEALDTRLAKKERWMNCVVQWAIWAPVPFSRVYLLYHTIFQVCVSSVAGFIYGFSFYIIIRNRLVMTRLDVLSKQYGLSNPYSKADRESLPFYNPSKQ
eukprot:TRINITY_DN10817_c0_g1_i2.p1 TRINITY_DN10817_c0_g1~~TRINITY_DN10817_c0_g1_i2.p1  ORF type:complete len:203 (+),score=32.97 TRINITY_DN10817_c0_g1_i2:56-664(+)